MPAYVHTGCRPPRPYQDFTLFYQVCHFFIFTEKLNRDPDKDGPVNIWKFPGMEDNMICISGDKGDAAQLLGLPTILFDDREENLVDVVRKGSAHNLGVLVRRGDAAHRPVQPRLRRFVINDPHDWVYWSFKFSQLWPTADILDLPPQRHLEAHPEITDAAVRCHKLQIDNTQPTEDICRHPHFTQGDQLVKH